MDTFMFKMLDQIARDEDGQDMVEYALLLGFIAIAAFVAVQATGTSIKDMWGRISTKVGEIAPGA